MTTDVEPKVKKNTAKSPRFPSYSLQDMIEKALIIYEREGLHDVPVNTAAQHANYKDATSGTALGFLASLRYYGLAVKKKEGYLSISSELRDYKNAPDEKLKKDLLIKWLKNPPVFSELLIQYADGLPSDATIKYNLTKQGFTDRGAGDCLRVFKNSIEFADYYNYVTRSENPTNPPTNKEDVPVQKESNQYSQNEENEDLGFDKIPVRLKGNRRAWLQIPIPFYESDKDRLKKQIDLIISDDEDED